VIIFKFTNSIFFSDSLKVMKEWAPPKELLNLDSCRKELRAAAKQTGFDRYRSWHRNFLKRAADETEVVSRSSRTSKRGRVV
jgi:IS1 family transposase